MDLTQEQINSLRLFRTEGIGAMRFKEALEECGSATKALEVLALKKPQLNIPSEKDVSQEIKALKKLGGQFLFIQDDNYPTQLKMIADAPPVLCTIGDTSILHQAQLAFVGSRNASAHGIKYTHQLCQEIVGEDIVITSGFARGVDTAAHKGALYGKGKTVAVLAGGVDVIYPPENEELYKAMLERGSCFVSEAPMGVEPIARHFPRRNRIISGLSQATVVVEATIKSGTMITAQTALDQGRELMAIPGHPADSRSHGPNKLIQQGAKLVQTAKDIIEELKIAPQPSLQKKQIKKTGLKVEPEIVIEDQKPKTNSDKLLNYVSHTGIEIDQLISLSGLKEAEINAWIVQQELMDNIERQAGGKICLK